MEQKGSLRALGLALNPAGFVSSGSTPSASLITGYQWVGKDDSFAFLHVACRVSWLPAPPPPCLSPSRAHLRSAAASRPLSHRLRGGVGPAPDPETAPWLCLIANEPSGSCAFSSAPFVFTGHRYRLDTCLPCLRGLRRFSSFLLRLCGS